MTSQAFPVSTCEHSTQQSETCGNIVPQYGRRNKMADPQALASYLLVFLAFAAFGLIISLSTEQSQIVAKVRGAGKGSIARGYNSAMKIMIVNRFGTIVYMFFVGLSIDIGMSNRMLLTVTMIAAAGVLLYNIFLIFKRFDLLGYDREEVNRERLSRHVLEGGVRFAIASYAATILNVLGLTLPLLLSNSLPEYRLSMANTGFLLNTFFTLINVLYLEAQLARILDSGDRRAAYGFALTVFLTRALALVTAIAIFAAIWWVS